MTDSATINGLEISRTSLRDYCVTQLDAHVADLPDTQRQLLIASMRKVSAGRQYPNPLEDATPPERKRALKQIGTRSPEILTECVASLYPVMFHSIAEHIGLYWSAGGTAQLIWQRLMAMRVTVVDETLPAHACIDFILKVGLDNSRTRITEPSQNPAGLDPKVARQSANVPIIEPIDRRIPVAKPVGNTERSRIAMPVQSSAATPKRASRTRPTVAQSTLTASVLGPIAPTWTATSVTPVPVIPPPPPSLRQARITVAPIVDRRAKRAAKAASVQTRTDDMGAEKPAVAKAKSPGVIAKRRLAGSFVPPRSDGPFPHDADAHDHLPPQAANAVVAAEASSGADQASRSESSPSCLAEVATFPAPSVGMRVMANASDAPGFLGPADPVSHLGELLSLLNETPATSGVWDDLRLPMLDLQESFRRAKTERTLAEHNRIRTPLANEISSVLAAHGNALRDWGPFEPVNPSQWTAASCPATECDATIALLGELRNAIECLRELETTPPKSLMQRDGYRTAVATAETRVADLVKSVGSFLHPANPSARSHDQDGDDQTDVRTYIFELEKKADARAARTRVATLLKQCLFSEAAKSMDGLGDELVSLKVVIEAMSDRLNFDLAGAMKRLDAIPNGHVLVWAEELRSELRNELKEMHPRYESRPTTGQSNPTENILTTEDQVRLLAEVYWQADLASRQGRMIDFVARIGGLVEQAVLAEVGQSFGRIFKSRDEYSTFAKSYRPVSARRNPGERTLSGDVFDDLNKRTQDHRNEGEDRKADRLHRIWVFATRLEKVKHLRNLSCVAHGLESVTKQRIDNALDQTVGASRSASERRDREVIATIPLELFGCQRVCWVASEILRELGVVIPHHNPLIKWGGRLAEVIETTDNGVHRPPVSESSRRT